MNRPTPSLCPVCGDALPPRARVCATCGACEKSGWNPDAAPGGLDLPDDDDFDYDRFVAEEFGAAPRRPPMGWFWWVVAVGVLLAFGFLFIRPYL